MIKKVLIWNTFDLLERAGGPSTYLFHLRQFYKTDDTISVTFLTDNRDHKKAENVPAKKSLIPQIVRNFVRINQALARNLKSYQSPISNPVINELNSFDIIHFHSTVELYQAIPLLINYSGSIVLTSHTPLAPHLEHLGEVLPLPLILRSTKRGYIKMDREAFMRADVLIFPASEAMEPYFNTWKDFKNIIANKRIEFVPTGVPEAIVLKEREEIFASLKIPIDAKVICYAGRHNHVKGYDLLKEFGEIILRNDPTCYFIILGKEIPLQGLDHPRWIEIGWTTDPTSYIKASDLFVLPNRQTYFDLILLEILSIGKKCLLSASGGNKYFKNLDTQGFYFFKTEDLNDMVEKYNQIDFSEDQGENLLSIYEKDYTLNEFGKKYIDKYLEIIK